MSIKFHYEHEEDKTDLTFGMVEVDQFFINRIGCLCQKRDYETYHVIASCNGVPFCVSHNPVTSKLAIQKILPRVVKITWDEDND